MVMKHLIIAFLLTRAIAELPPFIKPCSRTSPWLQFCVMKQIPSVISVLKGGYPQMGLKPLDPFIVDEMEIPVSRNFQLVIRNFQLRGLSRAKFEFIMVDPFKNLLEMRIRFPQINIQGFYMMRGRLFSVDVDTQGPAALTFVDAIVEAKILLRVVERDGNVYYEMPKRPIPGREMDVQMGKANMYFGNLVPNDLELNDRLNDMIRHSFFPLFDSIKPGIVSVMWQVAYWIASPLLAQSTVDEMFEE